MTAAQTGRAPGLRGVVDPAPPSLPPAATSLRPFSSARSPRSHLASPSFPPSQMGKGYALLCVSYPLSDLVIETHKEEELY